VAWIRRPCGHFPEFIVSRRFVGSQKCSINRKAIQHSAISVLISIVNTLAGIPIRFIGPTLFNQTTGLVLNHKRWAVIWAQLSLGIG